MTVFLFTWHAYQSWLPDRPQGYVRRGEGVLPPDPHEAAWYRRLATEEPAQLIEQIQRTMIETILENCEPLDFRAHGVATDPSHLHVLLGWTADRTWESMARSLRRSITSSLLEKHGRQKWFSRGRHAEPVTEDSHFEHLLTSYLPSHRGLFWSERIGWRESTE